MPQNEALFDAQRMAWYIFHVTKVSVQKQSTNIFFIRQFRGYLRGYWKYFLRFIPIITANYLYSCHSTPEKSTGYDKKS